MRRSATSRRMWRSLTARCSATPAMSRSRGRRRPLRFSGFGMHTSFLTHLCARRRGRCDTRCSNFLQGGAAKRENKPLTYITGRAGSETRQDFSAEPEDCPWRATPGAVLRLSPPLTITFLHHQIRPTTAILQPRMSDHEITYETLYSAAPVHAFIPVKEDTPAPGVR